MILQDSIKESGGFLNRYTHDSTTCQCEMTFSVFLPPQAELEKVPAIYWLSGLTCTDDNVRTKAGAQRYAAELGVALIFPDTSPRGQGVPDAADRYDLGKGAGFYVNATRQPWVKHYQMYDYITVELPTLIEVGLPIIAGQKSIMGHSMGGHGALMIALRNPESYKAVSAFSPICHPTQSAWGKGCFPTYLGGDEAQWQQYDATYLVTTGAKCAPILIDQGLADEFYEEGQLLPEEFEVACERQGQALTLRMQPGYDHSYHFISSFIGEHLKRHAKALGA
ncbi:MAG: S-formylglutathione hydrolase [Methylococcales bacterium]|jgi:S-formylglutathione hydrolase|nr:S-formylglutathione hydrolase [Methylococcales bacterium]MBT7444269.1 S-formylglutathione hydrolase [Methylococcales bacterium]